METGPMRVKLIAHTPEPEKVVAAAAKLCYSDAAIEKLLCGLTPEKCREFVSMLAEMGHESPTEHAVFTFAIEGVSRTLLAQITRHRLASFSVQSQRYVNLDGFDYVLPPEMAEMPQARALFSEAMEQQAEQYRNLVALLKEKHIQSRAGRSEEVKEMERQAEKQALEDARFLLPGACTTKMIVTMNARSLNNFFRLRCCSRAQWEIRALADEMLRLVKRVSPALFAKAGPACVRGTCPEGKMSCGKMGEMREKYAGVGGVV